MLKTIQTVNPSEIEAKSFAIITELLGDKVLPKEHEHIIKRVIHTTADFAFADLLTIHKSAIDAFCDAMAHGDSIITDTNMAKAGINKKKVFACGGDVLCFMADDDVVQIATEKEVTRASVCIDKALERENISVFVIGNAPTALIRLYERIQQGARKPKLIVGVPVGFVHVTESKELIKSLDIPYIIIEGRKGGSNIAAAIINAMLYKNV